VREMAPWGKSRNSKRPSLGLGRPLCARVMTSAGSPGEITRAAYDEAFPRVTDAATLYLWREPAFRLVQWAAAVELPAVAAIVVEALLAALVFALFWRGRLCVGLVVSAVVMAVSVVALMLPRLTQVAPATNRLRIAIELLYPVMWWWAWEHGLAAYGRPLEPIYATMVLWVVVGGTIAIWVVERLALHRFNGMEIHAWRALDTRFRLVSAGRNTDLAILAISLLLGRPDSGFVAVAWWTLISLIFHAVRLAQLTEQQARRQKISSWLDQ
jgi:hypothetical protein